MKGPRALTGPYTQDSSPPPTGCRCRRTQAGLEARSVCWGREGGHYVTTESRHRRPKQLSCGQESGTRMGPAQRPASREVAKLHGGGRGVGEWPSSPTLETRVPVQGQLRDSSRWACAGAWSALAQGPRSRPIKLPEDGCRGPRPGVAARTDPSRDLCSHPSMACGSSAAPLTPTSRTPGLWPLNFIPAGRRPHQGLCHGPCTQLF